MARFTCFSTLLTGKKKKSSKESHNLMNEKPKVKPEELILEVSEVPPTGTNTTKEELVPNADMSVQTTEKDDHSEKDEKQSIKSPLNMLTFLASPKLLKRSCSNIERKSLNLIINPPIKKPHSYDDLKKLSTFNEFSMEKIIKPDSPLSIKSSFSADKVMLKKRSSSQVLPSRSRKLWWRLFMWSHRNLHRPYSSKPVPFCNNDDDDDNNNNRGGYTSDTFEIIDEKKKQVDDGNNNQWFAFSAFDRVNAWVNSIPNDNDDDNNNDDIKEIGESSGKDQMRNDRKRRGGDEILQANNIIQGLNVFSSVAHISGMGLKVVPPISAFNSLKAINLSNNFIVNITAGALPKSLHTLDLSRNKIGVIEGLRELTRLRVLNLSYNRISRIGHGLSNCTAIKELYLAGNKISTVEGLHRLLKLAVLDLSFNKITTSKSLGQLVANYNSLLALNIVGNPIQTNIGDDQLKKSVCGLLPKLTYLNKQLVKAQRGREVAGDRVAKAALGNGQWGGSSRRKLTRKLGPSNSGSVRGVGGSGRTDKGKIRHRK